MTADGRQVPMLNGSRAVATASRSESKFSIPGTSFHRASSAEPRTWEKPT